MSGDFPISSIKYQLGGVTTSVGVGSGNVINIPASQSGTYRLSVHAIITAATANTLDIYVNNSSAGCSFGPLGTITGSSNLDWHVIIPLSGGDFVSFRNTTAATISVNAIHYTIEKIA